ncbi:uncharacterized protein J5M81_004738 [Pluvialis apricaria]
MMTCYKQKSKMNIASDIVEKPCNYTAVLTPLGSSFWITGWWVDKHTELTAELLKLVRRECALRKMGDHSLNSKDNKNIEYLPCSFVEYHLPRTLTEQLPGSCTCKHLNFLLAQSVCIASDIWLTGTWRNGIRSECCSYHSIIFIKRLKCSQWDII